MSNKRARTSTSSPSTPANVCASCKEAELLEPHSLSCGHVVCAECAGAITVVPSPTCTVCKAIVAPESDYMPALAACFNPGAQPGVHQPQHAAETHTPEDDALRSKAKLYLDAAAAAAKACATFSDNIKAFRDSFDAAVDKVDEETERCKAMLDALRDVRVAQLRRCGEDGLKELEAQQDELVVREEQLRAGAIWCTASVGKENPAQVLASLKTFDTLARKPGEALSKCLDDGDAWMPVMYTRPGVDVLGKFVKSFPIAKMTRNRGIAVSPDNREFAVSNAGSHNITIYAVADGAHIRTFGGKGEEPGKFYSPQKMVYHPDSGNLLVAEARNQRVQEVTPTGEAVRFIGAGVIDAYVCAIACNGALVAVGKSEFGNGALVAVGKTEFGKNDGVMLFDYGSGALVRSFGRWGAGVGRLGFCQGMRFTADGRDIVVASGCDDTNFRVSQWSIEGAFVKELGRGALQFMHDVALAGSGDWIACDHDANQVVVLSGVDGGEVRRWGDEADSDAEGDDNDEDEDDDDYDEDEEEEGDYVDDDNDSDTEGGQVPVPGCEGKVGDSGGKFKSPIALAQSASGELWVLDGNSARVQVFV